MTDQPVVAEWTGSLALALAGAHRVSQEEFAKELGVATRTVSNWRSDPCIVPQIELQRALDTVLETSTAAQIERFRQLRRTPLSEFSLEPVNDALEWLDQETDWPGSAQSAVQEKIKESDKLDLCLSRDMAPALHEYYGQGGDLSPLTAHVSGMSPRPLTVCSKPEWIAVQALQDQKKFCKPDLHSPPVSIPWTKALKNAAASKLAEVVRHEQVFFDGSLFRLTDINWPYLSFQAGSFMKYVLTWDTLERELSNGSMKLRSEILPDLATVEDVGNRHCCGGLAMLTAIARPQGDYMILVQERSRKVINGVGMMALVPKAFHESMDYSGTDVEIWQSATRELQEELLGREDVDVTKGQQGVVDPHHPDHQPTALRALLSGDQEKITFAQTGFGLNLLHGGFEISTMLAVHDSTWWEEYGGKLTTNWEINRIRKYSSLNGDALRHLFAQPNWSDESLLSMLLGLRELARKNPERVAMDPNDIVIEGAS